MSWCHPWPAGNYRVLTSFSAFIFPKWNDMWYLVKIPGTEYFSLLQLCYCIWQKLSSSLFIFTHRCSFANFVRCWHTALQHAKERNAQFSIDLFSFHRCHALSTIFRLNEKIRIACHRLKDSLIVKGDFIRGGRGNANLTLETLRSYRNDENFILN